MNVFRLVLCLAGLMVFLLVRHLSGPSPSHAVAPLPEPWEVPVQIIESETVVPASSAFVGPPRILRPGSGQVVGRLELAGKIITIREGTDGRPRYDVTTPDGALLGQELTELELQRQVPDLYELLRLTDSGGSVKVVTVQMKPDGQVK